MTQTPGSHARRFGGFDTPILVVAGESRLPQRLNYLANILPHGTLLKLLHQGLFNKMSKHMHPPERYCDTRLRGNPGINTP